MTLAASLTPSTPRTLLRDSGLPPLESRILLAHGLGWSRTELVTRADEALTAAAGEHCRTLFARRRSGEPVAYLVGVREFYGLDFAVSPAVLIPRPETELLVELALAEIDVRLAKSARADESRLASRPLTVLDLGTGSGAIAITLAQARPMTRMVATDYSPAALEQAKSNAGRLLPPHRPGGALEWFLGDWFKALPSSAASERFDLIVSNPPYIEAGDPHLAQGDLRFEPPHALSDGNDGLSAIRAISQAAHAWLRPGGALMLEHGFRQGPAVAKLLHTQGFQEIMGHQDLAGHDRITTARVMADNKRR